ncbi:hypothetical protein C5L14_14625 [Labrys okinawensis]|uniref:Tyr recombinase domain-containing protein n=1 Tax=Labrys okinawensis TaxID=346911 RepID=A0A2S9QB43_9HYPH|nr:site-specific integrase [Labrys okinawensis]PRH86566.1 hypothetical protein C5L14_14625 [Labrys okinawensis]
MDNVILFPGTAGVRPIRETAPGKTTLVAALDTAATAWRDLRSAETMVCQGRMVIQDLTEDLAVRHVEEVTREHIKAMVSKWKEQGYSASTIRKRLIVLKTMGCDTAGITSGVKKAPKWWLNDDHRSRLLTWLRTPVPEGTSLAATRPELADHIEWTHFTGLRIEETLRVKWSGVSFSRGPEVGPPSPFGMDLFVPGTKTEGSQATIPLSGEAGGLLLRRWFAAGCPKGDSKVFPERYDNLQRLWKLCRDHLGLTKSTTCTLKAIRRSAARYLHYDRAMPLDLTRQYLRHSNIQTTMEYLRLTGGASTEEMRRFL